LGHWAVYVACVDLSSLSVAIASRLQAAGCVFAEDEARLLIESAATPAELAAMVDRRVAGLPLEHVVGWAEFCGLRVAVDPGVFVPRRRTEFLVHEAAALARPGAVVVDLCCGSGAVGLAVVEAIRGPIGGSIDTVRLHSVDVDPAAVRCARRNVDAVGGRVYEGDLYAPLPAALRGRVELLVVNAPYVPTGSMGVLPPEAREHEHRVALDGGADGLDVVRRVVAEAPGWLAPGGHLLIETGERQAPRVVETAARNGLLPRVASSADENATVVVATRPAGGSPASGNERGDPCAPTSCALTSRTT
jgi:release factor glutamine methyltransferase